MVRASSGAGHFAAQQHLVADDDRLDHVGKPLGQRDRRLDLLAGEVRRARQPQPLHHLHAVALGDLGDLVEPVVDRIGADAIGDLLELGQVLVDLPGLDRNIRAERVLVAAERRVGDAMELPARRQRRLRHFDRGAEPAPDRRRSRRSGNREQRGRNAHCGQSRLSRNGLAYRAPSTVPSATASAASGRSFRVPLPFRAILAIYGSRRRLL